MIVIVLADFAVRSGGAERVAIDSARALAEAGAQVVYIHAVDGADAALDHPDVERVSLGLADVWSRGAASAAVNGVWNREAGRRLAKALSRFSAAGETVVHLHQWTRALSPSIFPTLRRFGAPLIVTAHDYFLACPNGVLFRFDTGAPCALTPMSAACVCTNCDARSYAHKLVRVARQAATDRQWRDWPLDVVHIADRPRAILAPLLPAGWRHRRIDNPIPATKAAPAEIGPNAAFAFVGRLTQDKGALIAAQAAAAIGADMLFIGEGPARADIEAALPGARITGWIGGGDVEALMRNHARALVAPSLWRETGPLTVREAAALGLPSIVSARCGASDQVDTASGVVAEPTVEAFAAAMRALMDDGAARAMGRAAYDRFWANPPTPRAHAAALLDLYRELLTRRAA